MTRQPLLLACLLLVVAARAEQYTTPITAWSTGTELAGGVNYEGLPAAAALTELLGHASASSSLTARAEGTPAAALASKLFTEAEQAAAEQPADLVLLLVTPQAVAPPAVEAVLRAGASGAASLLQLPNAHHEGGSSPVLRALRALPAGAELRTLGSCPGVLRSAAPPATAEAVAQALGQRARRDGLLVVLVCTDAAAGEGDVAETVSAALDAAAQLGGRQLAVHVATPAAAPLRRVALSVPPAVRTANYTFCNDTCQTQVKLLEGFIVFLVLALALGVGLACMHGVDTPTRFPKQRDAARPHGD